MENYLLIDHKEKHQYEFHIDAYIAKIEYIQSLNGEIYLTHTEVPDALAGHGVGSQLVEKTLRDIKRKGLRVVPLCPFVAAYIQQHPDWKHIVTQGLDVE